MVAISTMVKKEADLVEAVGKIAALQGAYDQDVGGGDFNGKLGGAGRGFLYMVGRLNGRIGVYRPGNE